MTERKDLLRPLEPAQRLAPADRETLEALQTTLGECASLITAQGETAREAAERQQELLQACADKLGRLAEQIDAEGATGAARHAELTEAVRQLPAALAGSPERLDGAGPEQIAGIHADLAGIGATLERIAATQELHHLQMLAMVKALEALGITLVAWRNETTGESAREAHLSQARTLGDLVTGTTSLAVRAERFEALLARIRPSPWLLVAIPLLLGFVYGAGLMTDVMIRFLDGYAGMSMPLVTDLPPWPPDAGPEAAAPE